MDCPLPPEITPSTKLAAACRYIVEQRTGRIELDFKSGDSLHLEPLHLLSILVSHPNLAECTLGQLYAENLLTQSAAQLLAQASTSKVFYSCDATGTLVTASNHFAALFGKTPQQLIGQHFSAILPATQIAQLQQWHAQTLTDNTPNLHSVELATQSGTHRVILSLLPVGLQGHGHLLGVIHEVPEEFQTSEQDRLAENELETIFQSLPDLFFRLASDGTILDYRSQNETELYAPPSYFLGKRMQDVLPEEVGDFFIKRMAEQRATGKLVCYEYDLPLPNGIARFEGRLRDLPGTDQMIVIVRNITEQHEQQQARKRAEQQLKLALDAAKEGVWDWSITEHLWSANSRLFDMLGYDAEVPPQSPEVWNQKVHPDDRQRRALAYQALLKGETDRLDVDFRARNAAGDWQWIRARGQVVERDATGRALRAVGTHEDITERKILDERLKLAATVFENTAEGVIIATPRGHIIEVNQGFIDVTGFSREEVIGRHVRLLNSGRQAPAFYRTIWRALLSEGSWRGEVWNRRKDGQIIPEWLNINAVYDDNRQISHFVAVFSDISVLKRSEEKLDHMAHHDALTGLPNRLMLQARLSRAIIHAGRNKSHLALLFLDVDRFKNINDSLGHVVGDDLLKQVAKRLKSAVRAEDTVARLGGDEFVVMLEQLTTAQAAAHVADKILHAIRLPFNLQGKEFFTTTSIGISAFPEDGRTPAELLRNADTAMYQVKNRGRDSYSFYTQQLTQQAQRKAEMESELHRAIQHNELTLQYQPQFDLQHETLIGLEALVRWSHPVKGMIAPDLFVPLAEESSLISKLGEWVTLEACRQIKQWRNNGFTVPRVAVNVSGAELASGGLLQNFTHALQSYGLCGDCLEAEITENFMMQDVDKAVEVMHSLRELAITIAVDDFGTGYSSLAYLQKLPIHRLKIDRAFVRDIPNNANDMAIAQSIIALGESLGLEILAEGIETREQQAFLREKGCRSGQGYLFSRPLDPKAVEYWLTKGDDI
ncbi:EAL domain-containing protein [Simiduia sp. 21SJ11W-1]|uniref:EAL domain-containing protein n=1 Tax=Simiduia sp. 21SJ11W-1 TaxID=2909669 RepID=UPI00209E6297|nr:EAL domain-containing protein [Simiduia sp. 21SJ11W-1]UTA47713.1 EAL domain-containing protein [Simiduia sp. 21SJ11W-1]